MTNIEYRRCIRLIASLAFYAVSESWRSMLRVFGRKPTAIVVAVHYHHVAAEDRLSFAGQMDHLVRWTRPISTNLGEQLGTASHYTIVTADDGWKSFLDNAIPELARRGIPVTIFVISHRLGESIDGISSDRIISEIELRNLANENVTIGSHSATHAVMTSIPEPDAFRELVESRERLSSIIGLPVRIFCFPYGDFSLELAGLTRTPAMTTCSRRCQVSSSHLIS